MIEGHDPATECDSGCLGFCIGENDKRLMMQLVKGGPVHAKFRRMIIISCDITAPLYWWKEFDTYKVGTVANSCSTMHKIHNKAFEMDDFSTDHMFSDSEDTMDMIIQRLEYNRRMYNQTKDKGYWWQMIQLLPSSYNQKRTVQFSYEAAANMHRWRKDHNELITGVAE